MSLSDADRVPEASRAHPGAAIWGDPVCMHCGYAWATSHESALDLVASAPQRFREVIGGREGEAMRKPDPATWSPAGYIWHLSDWFRIQGQRIYALAHDPQYRFVPLGVEPDELGEIFKYDELPPRAGLWALEHAAGLFVDAGRGADATLVFRAPDGSEWTVGQLIVWVGHEAVHHELDIARGLGTR